MPSPPSSAAAVDLQPRPLPSETVTCSACRRAVPKGLRFCPHCGASLRSDDQRAAVVPTEDPATGAGIGRRIALLAGALLLVVGAATGLWYYLGVTLTVTTTPAQARVLVDGKEAGVTAQDGTLTLRRLRRGSHTLQVEREGYQPYSQVLEIGLWETTRAAIALLMPSKVELLIDATPGDAQLFLNDQPVSATRDASGALRVTDAPVGRQTITVRRSGFLDVTMTVVLDRDARFEAFMTGDFRGLWSGRWAAPATLWGPAGEGPVTLTLTQNEHVLGGSLPLDGQDRPVSRGSAEGQQFSLTAGDLTYDGQLSADGTRIDGKWTRGGRSGTFWARRGVAAVVDEPASADVAARPDEAQHGLAQARRLFENGKYKEALAECQSILRSRPDHVEARELEQRIQKTLAILGAR
jgi:hypothetical protein